MGVQKQKKLFIGALIVTLVFAFFCVVFPLTISRPVSAEIDFDTFANSVMQIIKNNDLVVTEPGALSQATDSASSRPFALKRLIVCADHQIDYQDAAQVISGYQNLYVLQYRTEEATMTAYQYYTQQTDINWVEADSMITADGLQDDFSYTTWGAGHLAVPEYSNYLANYVGTENLPEILVAVLDSGIDTDHPWFTNRIRLDLGANYSSSENEDGYAFEDVHGHGTHVSGTICDLTMSNVKIIPVKVLGDTGSASGLQIALGIDYVFNLKKKGYTNIVAMNLSLGGESNLNSSIYNNILTNAIKNAGILPVVAAGNDSGDVANHSPANIEAAVTVSAINRNHLLANFSNYGRYIDVCAPGVGIVSACIGGGTISMSGTSMATPHVTAVAALLMSDPDHNYTMEELEAEIKNNTIDLGEPGWDEYFGVGLVNLENAFNIELPTYLITATAVGNGSISPSGVMVLDAEQTQLFTFQPVNGYRVVQISVDGENLTDSALADAIANGYCFTAIDANHEITVTFTARTDIPYQVKHYLQTLAGEYEIYQTDDLFGETATLTAAKSLSIPGFTGQEFTQQTIDPAQIVVVTINYLRNNYTINLIADDGIENMVAVVNDVEITNFTLKYETPIKITASLLPGYHWLGWSIDDNATIANVNQTIEITIPAFDITLNAHSLIKQFKITTVVGKNGTITPENPILTYRESQKFEFAPDDGYQVSQVFFDGGLIGPRDHLAINDITEPHMIEVTFEPIEKPVVPPEPTAGPKNTISTAKIILWGSIGVLGGTGAVMCVGMPIYHHKKKLLKHKIKRSKIVHSHADRLFEAIDYVRVHEIEFIKFCRANHLDYLHDYRNCIIKFYEKVKH